MVLWNFAVFRHFGLRTSCMGCVKCESAKILFIIWLLEKKLSLFKEVAIFSIITFKIGVIGIEKYFSFRAFWFRTSCMGYVNCEFAKKRIEYVYLKKKLSLFKEVAIFFMISFRIGFMGTGKYCSFLFLYRQLQTIFELYDVFYLVLSSFDV